jgi:hypothetical protein
MDPISRPIWMLQFELTRFSVVACFQDYQRLTDNPPELISVWTNSVFDANRHINYN